MKITNRERGMLVITITAIVLGLNYLLIIPMIRSWRESGVKLKSQQHVLVGMQQTIQHKDEWRKEYDELKKGLGQQTVQFKYTSDVVKKIQEVATSSGVQINATRQMTEEDKGVYRVLPVQCTIESSTESLVKFLFALQTGAGFMSVEQLTLSPRPENPGILRCEIQVRALAGKLGSTTS
jgi:Tfp pilus assembly protein PilO